MYISSIWYCVHKHHHHQTLYCTSTVVTSRARTLLHTVTQTVTRSGLQRTKTAIQEFAGLALLMSELMTTALLRCGAHVLLKHHKSYSPGSGVWGDKSFFFLFSLDIVLFILFSFSVKKRGGAVGLLTTHQAWILWISSVQAWSLTSGKRQRGYSHWQKLPFPTFPHLPHALYYISKLKHGFIIPTGKKFFVVFLFFFLNWHNEVFARKEKWYECTLRHTHIQTLTRSSVRTSKMLKHRVPKIIMST